MNIKCPKTLLFASMLVFSAEAATAQTTITSVIENLPSSDGQVLMSLCNEEQYGRFETCVSHAVLAASQVTHIFEGVPLGRYGISVFHDANENGKLDFRWYGPPKEAYGASLNPPSRFGPPRFEDIAFEVTDEPLEFTIKMRGGR